MKIAKKLFVSMILFFTLFGNSIISQDHWETAIYANDQWHYFVGESEPELNWRNVEFNDSDWQVGPGSIGYGDGDDETIIHNGTLSLFIRKTFTLNDMNDIESLSHGMLFWRSCTQFIGGMGIIVFSIAILPLLGIGGVQLFKAEVAGPTADKLTPRVKQTAKYLWSIYLGFVILQSIILMFEGLSLIHI